MSGLTESSLHSYRMCRWCYTTDLKLFPLNKADSQIMTFVNSTIHEQLKGLEDNARLRAIEQEVVLNSQKKQSAVLSHNDLCSYVDRLWQNCAIDRQYAAKINMRTEKQQNIFSSVNEWKSIIHNIHSPSKSTSNAYCLFF